MVFRSVMSMMKARKIIQVFSILLFANGIEGSSSAVSKPKDFGPYDLVWHKADSCPDFRTMPSIKISVKLVHEPNEKAKLAVNYTTNETVHVDKHSTINHYYGCMRWLCLCSKDFLCCCSKHKKTKIKFRMLNNEKERRVLWGYNVDKPCNHFILGPYFYTIINNDRCIVEKASKSIVLSLDITSALFGESFFYGTYLLRASLHERNKNFLCVTLSFSFVKKVKLSTT